MNQSVAIDTGFTDQAHLSVASDRKRFSAELLAGVPGIGMAVLAQIGETYLEKVSIGRAVRIVAVGAIVAHRSVFPQKRAALFRVAAKAGFIGRCSFEQRWPLAAVGVVTLRAFSCTIAARHHGVLSVLDLRPFGLMAGETNALWHSVTRGMQRMAISATHPAHVVRTARPIGMRFVIFVASKAGAVFFCRG